MKTHTLRTPPLTDHFTAAELEEIAAGFVGCPVAAKPRAKIAGVVVSAKVNAAGRMVVTYDPDQRRGFGPKRTERVYLEAPS